MNSVAMRSDCNKALPSAVFALTKTVRAPVRTEGPEFRRGWNMFKPLRNSGPSVRTGARTAFVKAKTAEGKALLQSERMATLFIEGLRSYVPAGGFKVNE